MQNAYSGTPCYPRVALLINQPAPYRVPLYSELARRFDFFAIFDQAREAGRQWQVRPEDLDFHCCYANGLTVVRMRSRHDVKYQEQRTLHIRYDLLWRLATYRPDVVVSAEFGPRTLQAAAYCLVTRTPLIIWSEGTPHSEGFVPVWKVVERKGLVRIARRFWSNGVESTALLQSYRAATGTIDEFMTGVDTVWFHDLARHAAARRNEIRSQLGVDGAVLLFIGQYNERKGLTPYLNALVRLHRRAPGQWTALFVGGGEGTTQIQATLHSCPGIRLQDLGFKTPPEVAALCAASDWFVLPTIDDNWSLSALESAVAGLPQLCSRYNGCRSELLDYEGVGVEFDPLDDEDFDRKLATCLFQPARRVPETSVRVLVEQYSVTSLADRVESSILTCLAGANTALASDLRRNRVV